jgi:hypothetical protein
MLIEELRRLYRSEPFRPIEFELDNGRRFVITRPGLLMINETGSKGGFVIMDGDLDSPDPIERGEEPYWFRGNQVVRVGYVGDADQRRATG